MGAAESCLWGFGKLCQQEKSRAEQSGINQTFIRQPFFLNALILCKIEAGNYKAKQARKLQATLVRNYHLLTDGGEV